MSINHSVSDLATIIRNGYMAKKNTVTSLYSKLRINILDLLKSEGYILSYSIVNFDDSNLANRRININLKYYNKLPVITEIKVISKPGKRIYKKSKDISLFKNGLGSIILSTSKGILTDYQAKKDSLGGEILLEIF